jgi:hypothetical protein
VDLRFDPILLKLYRLPLAELHFAPNLLLAALFCSTFTKSGKGFKDLS